MNVSPSPLTGLPHDGIELEALTVADVMVRKPKECGPSTRVGDLRRFFRDDHVHAALIVHDGKLVTVIEPGDIGDAEGGVADTVLAARLGRLLDRVVLGSTPLRPVHRRMLTNGRRRLAVVDDMGRLVGLLCLKRNRRGFCSDDDVSCRALAAAKSDPAASVSNALPAIGSARAPRVPDEDPSSDHGPARDVIATLERWCRFGGTWRVTVRTSDTVTFSLRRCDGDDEQQQIVTSEPDVLTWLTCRVGDGVTRDQR